MRLLLAFFLSLCLSLNAAYAAATDICDLTEMGRGHSAMIASEIPDHFGHHEHNDNHTSIADGKLNPSDTDTSLPHGDHCHPHQCFTSVPPETAKLPTPHGRQLPPVGVVAQLFSVSSPRLERPPRATLA